ncbi:MAG TPA: TerB family tellurite resistance protein [Methylophaga aminisulfidivorans]|uniref:TerB family tellurite resistance protein n=1 Tax=Methylophaga aminisulfidivorans TaxID=230105 RepID=A0A7C1W1Q1_9GAMM|nr:TerB family tellurite resistance protein [Methylophaga aminisulfidivorans]
MIAKLKEMFASTLGDSADDVFANTEQTKLLASVALMIEIIAADNERHDTEKSMLRQILANQFGVKNEAANDLISRAEKAHSEATDFFYFTADINEHFNEQEKIELIESLWKIAWADHEIQDIEQHIIRKLASLLYVSHKDFIATKLRVVGDPN